MNAQLATKTQKQTLLLMLLLTCTLALAAGKLATKAAAADTHSVASARAVHARPALKPVGG